MQNVENAVAFVTGGASGIGLGIARALAAQGARVAVADIRDDHLEEAREIAMKEGWANRAISLKLDVTDRAAFANALDETERALGPLRILVNNAGVGIAGPIVEAAFPDWEWGISVNLGGVVNGIVFGLAENPRAWPRRPCRQHRIAWRTDAGAAGTRHLRNDEGGGGRNVGAFAP